MSGHEFSVTPAATFFPLQWTKVCLSFNGNNSEANFAVDGVLLREKSLTVEEGPQNVTVVLGLGDGYKKGSGQITNLNIFSTPRPNKSKMMTMSGSDICGATGYYLNMEDVKYAYLSDEGSP